jgi:hypothetical protein
MSYRVANSTIVQGWTIRCGVCGFRGPYNATEWWHHLMRKCREAMKGRMY